MEHNGIYRQPYNIGVPRKRTGSHSFSVGVQLFPFAWLHPNTGISLIGYQRPY